MDKKVEKAMDNIALIRSVIERTNNDFSKISSFFIGIGIVNLIELVIEQLTYGIRNTMGYGTPLVRIMTIIDSIFPMIGYIVLFYFFYKKIKLRNNDISKGMIKMWGIVLIGSQIMSFLFMWLLPAGNNDIINTLWKCKELIIILPVIVTLLMTGILTQKKIISCITIIFTIIYFTLFVGMKEVKYGLLAGVGTKVSMSSMCIRCMMILGMIILGLYLKKGDRNGNKFNTRSLSDEA